MPGAPPPTLHLHSLLVRHCSACFEVSSSCTWLPWDMPRSCAHEAVTHQTRRCHVCRACIACSCGALTRTAASSGCRLGGVRRACPAISACAAGLTCLPVRPCQQGPLREHTLPQQHTLPREHTRLQEHTLQDSYPHLRVSTTDERQRRRGMALSRRSLATA